MGVERRSRPATYPEAVLRYLVYLALAGAAIYLLIALIQAAARRRAGPAGTPGGATRRPLAPDDDPAFLAELDRRRRAAERRAREKRGSDDVGDPAPGDAARPGDATAGSDGDGTEDRPDGPEAGAVGR